MTIVRRSTITSILMLSGCLLANAAVAEDTCLFFTAENLAKGAGNFFIYQTFSKQHVAIHKGDVLVYEVFLDPGNPVPKGGIDAAPGGNETALRDAQVNGRRVTDQNGLIAHGDALLTPAVGKWYLRRILLDALAGKTIQHWDIVFEGDKPGRYVQFIDNVRVERPTGAPVWIYKDGNPPDNETGGTSGYSKYPVLVVVPRDQVQAGPALQTLVQQEIAKDARRRQVASLRHSMELFDMLAPTGHEQMRVHVEKARQALERIAEDGSLSTVDFNRSVDEIRQELQTTKPLMHQFTGHLVGHAHIDLQWLWQWPETIDICKHTFGQAVRFMDEFPDFTFTQSSSCLYAATEKNFPDLFKKIQHYVAEGRWEIVGGRVCEAGEHMISPEAHARHFLYAQRYFREHFGKQATVGWEPDTFGHTAQMPQILRNGGCDSYYFCRGGKGIPLFWWEALDGTRVLALESPATGFWYDGSLGDKQFQKLADFYHRTGSKDMLWVYGVGDHGGGPTREQIETALGWQKDPYLPRAKFSTATAFFKALRKYDLSKLPVIQDELNTPMNGGFFGTYTTHSDVKRWNRDAESTTESAEAAASVASRFGFSYPGSEFRRNWVDICWNHHHDTISGTAVHASYVRTGEMFTRVIKSSANIAHDAVQYLANRVNAAPGSLLVFNPLGFPRDGLVKIQATPELRSESWVAVAESGDKCPVQILASGEAAFIARQVPSFGYRTYQLRRANAEAHPIEVADKGSVIENRFLQADLDTATGVVKQVFDRQAGRDLVPANGSAGRFEIHWEAPNGMSAWTIGHIDKVQPLIGRPDEVQVIERGPVRATVRIVRQFDKSKITEDVSLLAGTPYLQFATTVDWNEVGTKEHDNPFLKVAFDMNLSHPVARYEVPFGSIERPIQNQEVPALKWADLSQYAPLPVKLPSGVPVTVDLSGNFDADIFSSAAKPTDGQFDNDGRTFPATILPGRSWTWHDVPFVLPSTADGAKNAVVAEGQRIALPRGKYATIGIIGASSDGDAAGPVLCEYADGTSQTEFLAFTDWCHTPSQGETVALTSDHRHDRNGNAVPACSLFLQTIHVDPQKELAALQLPNQPKMRIVAITVGDFGPIAAPRGAAEYGASLMNDCKFGHSAEGHTLRLSLLRCSFNPDPKPDVGVHFMQYALYPHRGDWRTADTERLAYAYNHPLLTAVVPSHHSRELPPSYSLLRVSPEDILITGLKKAEDNNRLIVRMYEDEGKATHVTLTSSQPIHSADKVNFIEDVLGSMPHTRTSVTFPLRHFEIRTVRLDVR